MTPIERMSEKSRALDILNLPNSATTGDIRAAFKKLVQERHPDHGGGSSEEFAAINDAYHFLWNNTAELGIRNTMSSHRTISRTVSRRPSIQPTETAFSEQVIRECEAALPSDSLHRQHVSTQLHRIGRRLTYFVPSAPANGPNEVAVPTGELVDSRHARPQVVELDASDLSAGVYDVPQDLCATLFPGARSVKIHFAQCAA